MDVVFEELDADEWNCSTCTAINDNRLSACDNCNKPRNMAIVPDLQDNDSTPSVFSVSSTPADGLESLSEKSDTSDSLCERGRKKKKRKIQMPKANNCNKNNSQHPLLFEGRSDKLDILMEDIADYARETNAPWMKPKKSTLKGGKTRWQILCKLGPIYHARLDSGQQSQATPDPPEIVAPSKNVLKRRKKRENLLRGCKAKINLVFQDSLSNSGESPLARITTAVLDHTCEPSARKEKSIQDKSTTGKIPTKILQGLVHLVKIRAQLFQYKAFIIDNKLNLSDSTRSLQNIRNRVQVAIDKNEVDHLNYAGYYFELIITHNFYYIKRMMICRYMYKNRFF